MDVQEQIAELLGALEFFTKDAKAKGLPSDALIKTLPPIPRF